MGPRPAVGEVPADRQQAARDADRRSVDTGEPLSAAELAGRFERSPRWAQERIAEVRAERNGTGDTRSAGHAERSAAEGTAAGHAAPVAGRSRTAAGGRSSPPTSRPGNGDVWLDAAGHEHEMLFMRNGKLLGHRVFYDRAYTPTIKGAGMEGRFTFHGYRHHVASQLLSEGVDLPTVAGYIGDHIHTIACVYAVWLRDKQHVPAGVLDGSTRRTRAMSHGCLTRPNRTSRQTRSSPGQGTCGRTTSPHTPEL